MSVENGSGRLCRLAETGREALSFHFDGLRMQALSGDTVLTGVLLSAHHLRMAEFGPERRAGFCLMGACQDCWIWQEDGPRCVPARPRCARGCGLCHGHPRIGPRPDHEPGADRRRGACRDAGRRNAGTGGAGSGRGR
ncbi:2Fe-2S iron-sulfur cluster-binding protein [Paracoccus methylarcula]|uniref:2Fe-2S iron-sulfur cluster-binding protein n=1 Tax=Paracoccus methylarcula TaxID=72022 RepID=UPI001B864EB1|nr:2Fe-2S iron-sulfur cluster-binding protein [Paracoccus methylarcula]